MEASANLVYEKVTKHNHISIVTLAKGTFRDDFKLKFAANEDRVFEINLQDDSE